MLRALVALFVVTASMPSQVPGSLPNFERRTPVVLAVENVGPAVVNIRAQSQMHRRHIYFGLYQSAPEEQYADRSLGSGVVIHRDGLVLTNEHVIHDADRVLLKFKDGREAPATVVNSSIDSDLALLKIEAAGPFPTAELGDSDDLMVGEPTFALGNPFGLSSSVTTGVLSAVDRSVRFGGRTVYRDFLQTSALINPGNSGGPLLDINGRVIGINVAIDSRGQGIGFAIPINRAKAVMTDLVNPEVTSFASVGFEPIVAAGRLRASRLAESGPAARAGIQEGDIILSINGRPVMSPFDFNAALLGHRPNEEVSITVDRSGRAKTYPVRFESVPLHLLSDSNRNVFGMECGEVTAALARRLSLPQSTLNLPVVLGVKVESPAHEIGIRAGDVIVQVENYRVRSVEQLLRALQFYRREGSARVQVFRANEGVLHGTLML